MADGDAPSANPAVTTMLVTVPPNVRVGEQMVAMTPTGQQYMVVVPGGADPGSQFQIAVPRSDAPSLSAEIISPALQPPARSASAAMGGDDPSTNPSALLTLVTVPPNVSVSEQMAVATPTQMVVATPTGQHYMLVAPEGAAENINSLAHQHYVQDNFAEARRLHSLAAEQGLANAQLSTRQHTRHTSTEHTAHCATLQGAKQQTRHDQPRFPRDDT